MAGRSNKDEAVAEPVFQRNNTSYPVMMTEKLRKLHARYHAAQADTENIEHEWASLLRYYQYTVRSIFAEPDFGLGSTAAGTSNARGILCYHAMGLGKTRLAVAVALALWDVRPIVVMLPRSLRANFTKTIADVLLATDPRVREKGPEGTYVVKPELLKNAIARFTFVSMDAYNSAEQMSKASSGVPKSSKKSIMMPFTLDYLSGGLDGKLLIVDEAHNFFRAIINGDDESNARRIYDLIMISRNLRLLFLTGTPASKDPFELVPCFNMLAGFNLFPTQYETFYELYVDKGKRAVKNREHFANRIIGLVSHVTHMLPTEPKETNETTAPETVLASSAHSVEKLWELTKDLPVQELSTDVFDAIMREPVWGEDGKPFSISPFDVMTNPAKYPVEFAKIGAADLQYPVLLAEDEDGGNSLVIDGMHRIAKTILSNSDGANNKVKAIYVNKKMMEEAKKEPKTKPLSKRQPRDDGWFPEALPLIIDKVEMGHDQYRQYLLARERDHSEGGGSMSSGFGSVLTSKPLSLPGADKKAARSYYVHSRSIGNFMVPKGYADVPINDIPIEQFTSAIGPKLAVISERAYASPGPVLVYSQFVDVGGLRPLTRYLQKVGFQEWGKEGSIDSNVSIPFCYAVISGEVATEARAAIVKAFNSPANSHGKVIKAILVSKTGAEGLDLKWIRETHQIEPYWDRARDDQVRARAVRVGSHDGLPTAEREVQPYLYIAVANHAIWSAMIPTDREQQTIDEIFYERATARYELNSAFREVLSEACLECELFGYGAATKGGKRRACRTCVPTNAPLWHRDPATDARLPDSCELQSEREITATAITVDGTKYFYEEDPTSPFGFNFYELRLDLGAYAVVDLSNPIIPKLVRETLLALAGPGLTLAGPGRDE